MSITIRTAMRVAALILGCGIHLQAATTIWAATSQGPYKSIDSGASWQAVPLATSNALLQGTVNVRAVALDPQQPATVYLAGRVGATAGFFRSRDNGSTWTAVTLVGITVESSIGPGEVWLVVDPVSPNHLYLGSSGSTSVNRSSDSGDTWSAIAVSGAVTGLSVDPSTPGMVFASVGSKIYKSIDFGSTWALLADKLNLGSAILTHPAGPVIVDPRNSSVLYVGNSGTSPGSCRVAGSLQSCGLFKSTDGGHTWQAVGPPGTYSEVVFDAKSNDLYVGANVTGVGGSSLKSPDGGSTWTPLNKMTERRLTADPGAASHILGIQATASDSVFTSADGGQDWTSVRLLPAPGSKSTAFSYVSGLAVPKRLGNVSAAGFQSGPLAPESIVSALGFELATQSVAATFSPLPTNLGGTVVTITDSTGVLRAAELSYVSAGQVNYEIPAGTAPGLATVTITNGDGVSSAARLQIDPVAPGLFTLNASGLVAGLVVRVSTDGLQSYENVYQLDGANTVQARPIDLSGGGQTVLLLYGTGVRAAGTAGTSVIIGGENATVLYAGPQGQFDGEDQINVALTPSLAGRGSVSLAISANGRAANPVNVTFK